MPFDPYALCPGGRDKKIRFCCPNMLKEIEQVSNLLESDQVGACLAYIESIEKDHPNCACLTTAKLSIYRRENRWEEALTVAKQFYAQEPENPSAAAEYALALAVTGKPHTAVSVLIDAYEISKTDTVHSSLLTITLQVGAYLLHSRLIFPVIAVGNQLKEFPMVAEAANMLLYRATSDTAYPLLLRDSFFDYECPSNFPGKAEFEDAVELVRFMRWKQALTKLESLTKFADSWPAIWRNIAALRFWLLENEKACEALRIYASLPNTPPEDAVDAEAVRLLTTPDAFGDQTALPTIEYIVNDAEKAFEKLLSDSKYYQFALPDQMVSPPPKGTFMLLDRPFPTKESALTLENVSSQQAVCLLFGKETDREARLVVNSFLADELEQIEGQIKAVLGDLIQFPCKTLGQETISKTRVLVQYRFRFSEETYPDADVIKTLINDYYAKTFTEAWCNLPMGLLGGKTPSAAANELQYKIPLSAAMMVLEAWMHEETGLDVTQHLRQKLGLPLLDTISVSSGEDDPLSILADHPVWRWHRFDAEKMLTETLEQGLQIVSVMKETRAIAKFAKELLNRPMDSMPFSTRVLAFESLITVSEAYGDAEEALLWVDRAKNESAAQNIPDAAWCLHEITLRLMQGNQTEAEKIVQYLVTNYRKNSQVMDALQELFVRLGMLNPDGSPSAAVLQRQQAIDTAKADASALWTPDGTAGQANASKLWVPD